MRYLKVIILIIMSIFSFALMFSQNKKYEGKIVKELSGAHKENIGRIVNIISAWDSISPPREMEVKCYGLDKCLEIYFIPYFFQDGKRVLANGGPHISFYINDPSSLTGSPVASGVFCIPVKTSEFYGYPIYNNGAMEVTVICKENIPLFVSVSQEQYLLALIADIEKDEKENAGGAVIMQKDVSKEIENTYRELLKVDKKAAEEYKAQMDEFKKNFEKENPMNNTVSVSEALRKELSGMSAQERKRQAYYGGAAAMEAYHNFSGLLPYADADKGDKLAMINPLLSKKCESSKIELLVIAWFVGSTDYGGDKPRFYKENDDRLDFSEHAMSRLYFTKYIWDRIFQICE